MLPGITLLIKLLSKSQTVLLKGVQFILYGGIYSYIGITLFFILPHIQSYPPIEAVLESASRSLATSWQIALENARIAATSQGITYFEALSSMVGAVIDLLWFYRTVSVILKFKEGSDISTETIVFVAFTIFNILAWSFTGEIPALEVVEFAKLLPEALDFESLWSFGNESLNQSSGITVNASDSVNISR